MYKNFVFDIGNVLLDFNPLSYLSKLFSDQKVVDELYNQIFKSKEWSMLDEGTITEEEAFKLFCTRSPKNKESIMSLMYKWYELLTPIEESVKVLCELKSAGYKLYALSNYHLKAFDDAYRRYDFFKLFDGLVISARINLIKPNPKIYEYLIEKYNIAPQESVFIDDTKENTEAAKKLGFTVINLTNPSELRAHIKNLGVSL